MLEAGITRSEVVQRQADPALAQIFEQGSGEIQVLHERALGHLDFEAARRESRFHQNAADTSGQGLIPQLQGGHVDRDGDVRGPVQRLGAGLTQQLLHQGVDEPHLLGERDELSGRHPSAVGMPPPCQSLDPDDPPRREVDQWLVKGHDLAVFHGEPQICFQAFAIARADVHRVIENAETAPPIRLGLAQRDPGLPHRVAGVSPLSNPDKSRAERQHDIADLGQAVGFADRRHEALSRARVQQAPGLDEQREFVPADAGQHTARRQRRLQTFRDELKQAIRDGMAMAVVDGLKLVHADYDKLARPVTSDPAPPERRG